MDLPTPGDLFSSVSSLPQIFSLPDLASDILTIMRLRLKRFLDFLETSPGASGGLLASLDADTCQWVRSARDFEAEGSAEKRAQSHKEAKEPLRSTHGVLLCLARALPPDSRYKVTRALIPEDNSIKWGNHFQR